MKWYYIVVAACAALTVFGKVTHTVVSFFYNMGRKVSSTETKVDTILNNHLPHMDQRISRIEDHLLG